MKYLKEFCMATGHSMKSMRAWPRGQEVYAEWEAHFLPRVAMLEALNKKFALALITSYALCFSTTPNYVSLLDRNSSVQRLLGKLKRLKCYQHGCGNIYFQTIVIRTIEDVEGWPTFEEASKAHTESQREIMAEISAKFKAGMAKTFA